MNKEILHFSQTINKIEADGFSETGIINGLYIAGKNELGYIFNKKAIELTYLLYKNFYTKRKISYKTFQQIFLESIVNNINNGKISIEKSFKEFSLNIENVTEKTYTLFIPVNGIRINNKYNFFEFELLNKKLITKISKNKEEYNLLPETIAKITDLGDSNYLEEKYTELLNRRLNWLRAIAFKYSRHFPSISVSNNRIEDRTIFFKLNNSYDYSFKKLKTTHPFDITNIKKQRVLSKAMAISKKPGELNDAINTSAEWLGKFYSEHDAKSRYLNLIVSLESLFSPQSENYSSITASISEKSAFLFEKGDRKNILDRVKSIYQLRSKVVHSGSLKNTYNLGQDYSLVLSILERTIELIYKKKFVNLNELNEFFFSQKFLM
ncbi:hypothetical protein JWG40_13570 [Leptospira sp. 201903074]|uniref:HEPN domain-containing protein n=1 Tax=Leptospira abararensis TaxID=2810036 RepID=UPI0019626B3E|nr:HEPN domain-containing protein [Leptospira abararensis]MBM9548056.1 hypothetical protein [Leptospira abararensis]